MANLVFGGLINDAWCRALLGRFSGCSASSLLVASFQFLRDKHADEHYGIIFIGTGLVYGVAFPWMCCKVKEGEYPPPNSLLGKGIPEERANLSWSASITSITSDVYGVDVRGHLHRAVQLV